MAHNFYALFDDERLGTNKRASSLGHVIALMSCSEFHRRLPVDHVGRFVSPALEHGNCKILFNCEESPVACVFWALLTENTANQYKSSGMPFFHPSDLNEGHQLWIIDLIAPFGNFYQVAYYLRRKFMKDYGDLHYLRRARGTNARNREPCTVHRGAFTSEKGPDGCPCEQPLCRSRAIFY